jgi:hypothetical protein
MDFVQDRTADGRPFRMLVVLDEYTPECLAIEVARNFRGEDIVAVLDELTAIRGAPAHLQAADGPEMISKVSPEGQGSRTGCSRYFEHFLARLPRVSCLAI